MDLITIADLEVFYRVGVPEAERAQPQRLLLTLEMTYDFTNAAAHDDVRATIDYSAVAERLLKYGESKSWRLIESLAVELAGAVLREFAPRALALEVKKFIVPQARYVSVRIERAGRGGMR